MSDPCNCPECKKARAEIADLNEACEALQEALDSARAQRSAAHRRVDELTEDVERLRTLARGYLCDKLRILRDTQLAHGVTPTCQLCLCADGDHCEAVRKVVDQ